MQLKTKPSINALLISNLVPLIGIIFFDWNIFSIMIAYWLENLVIGFYNILKIKKAGLPNPDNIKMNGQPIKSGLKNKLIYFFIMHFGGFTLVHGIFVFILFGILPASDMDSANSINSINWDLLNITFWGIVIMFISMLISHGISYKNNFIGKGEYKKISPGEQMFKPYNRVMIMHIIIISSGFIIGLVGTGKIFACLIVLIKILLDYWLHKMEHSKHWKNGSLSSGSITISNN